MLVRYVLLQAAELLSALCLQDPPCQKIVFFAHLIGGLFLFLLLVMMVFILSINVFFGW